MSRVEAAEALALIKAHVSSPEDRERLRELAITLGREAPTAEMRTAARLRSLELGKAA